MTNFSIEGPAIKKMLKRAKKAPVAFAFSMGKSEAETYFGMNILKPAPVMLKDARGQTGDKAASGMSSLVGKEFRLTCDTLIPGLAKKMKKHLRQNKVMLNVVVMDVEGNILESDIEDIEDDPELDGDDDGESDDSGAGEDVETATQSQEQSDEDNAADDAMHARRKGWLTDRFKAVIPVAKQFAAINPNGGPRVVEALKSVQSALGQDALDAAEKTIGNLEKLLQIKPMPMAPPQPPKAKEETLPPSDDDLDKIRQKLKLDFAALGDDLKLFLKRGEPSLSGKASQLAKAFGADITGDDMKRAALLVGTLKNFLSAHLPNLPIVSEAERAADAIAAASGPAPEARYTQAAELQVKYAKGSVAAREAFDGFAKVLGDQPITPDLLTKAKAEIDTVKTERAAPQLRLEKAKALPDGPEKTKLIEAAAADLAAVESRVEAAIAFEKAARSKDALTKALSHGPLSAESGRTLPDDTAAALINAYVRDPDFAGAALDMASGLTHPEALAKGLPVLMDLKDAKFAANGQEMDPDKADKYAKDLLKMGGNVGADFFDRMPRYMAKGRQFDVDPLGEAKLKSSAARAQKRSVKLASELVGSNGEVKPKSTNLRNRVDHMLFNPTSLENPMPAMNEYALKSIKMFEDPEIAKKANKILGRLPDTAPVGSAGLVNTALRRKSDAPVGKKDMQTAVMASMLKSLDQGPVGSCFSTAPARRVRETDPMAAMDAYAQIAGKGKYKPPHGVESAAVTRIHKGEDPIMRSWEYTLATSAAKEKGSKERGEFDTLMSGVLGNLSVDATNILVDSAGEKDSLIKGVGMALKAAATHKGRAKQLKLLVSTSFDFVYNPIGNSGAASDGKSTDGRYIMTRKSNGKELLTEADFVEQMLDIALGVYGIKAGTPEADELRDAIEADSFMNPIRNSDEKPWEISPGGYGEAVTRLVQGKKQKGEEIMPKGKKTDNESERTKQMFAALLTEFAGSKDQMQTVENIGMHAFNGLPQDPSLQKMLAGGKDKIAENIQTHLIDKGKEIATTSLSVERSQYLFDKMVADLLKTAPDMNNKALLDTGATTHRPTVGMTPKELDEAFEKACKTYLEKEASEYDEPDKKALQLKAKAKKIAKSSLIEDVAPPEFMIADTNWGDAESHTYFVVAPDPITGDPIMWEKTIPPGNLSPAGKDWVIKKWTRVK